MTYLSAVMADSPRHYWRCADPGGNILHDIGSTPKALFSGTGSRSLPYMGPNSDGGSFLNGNDQYWNLEAETLGPPITVEVWVWQVYRTGGAVRVVDVITSGGFTLASVGIDASGNPQGFGSGGPVLPANTITTQAWHHIAFVVPVSAASYLVLDGVQLGTGAAGGGGTIAALLCLGATVPGGASRFNGAISEAAIYNSALSLARIQAHYAAADNTAARPVFKPYGTWSITTGVSGMNTTDTAAILDAVTIRAY